MLSILYIDTLHVISQFVLQISDYIHISIRTTVKYNIMHHAVNLRQNVCTSINTEIQTGLDSSVFGFVNLERHSIQFDMIICLVGTVPKYNS